MITLILATAMVSTVPAPKAIPAGQPHIHVSEIHMIDNVDGGDALGANRADLYALVTVNDITYKTEIMSKDKGNPNWMIPIDMGRRYSKVRINLLDDDGGLEGKDDHIDINPRSGRKDLTFTYDRYTGRFSGSVNGRLNQVIKTIGKGEDDKANFSFSVMKSW